jgi:multimeric flavodoxin WrbA
MILGLCGNTGGQATERVLVEALKMLEKRKLETCLWNFRGKPGTVIAVGGDRAGGQELALQQISTYCTINGVLTLSGGLFGANLGASIWSKDNLAGVKEDKKGFRGLRKTVKGFSKHINRGESET